MVKLREFQRVVCDHYVLTYMYELALKVTEATSGCYKLVREAERLVREFL